MSISLIDGHDDRDKVERCVCCGRRVPEGMWVCPICESEIDAISEKIVRKIRNENI